GVDRHSETGAYNLGAGRPGLAAGAARGRGLARHQQLQLREGGRADHDVGRGDVGQAAAAEAQVDGVGDVVREIGESGHTINRRGTQAALQGAAARVARRSNNGGVVAAAQVAILIFNPDLRLLRKSNTGHGAARRLGQDNQSAGGVSGHGQYAVDEAEGVISSAQATLGDGDRIGAGDIGAGGAQCRRASDATGGKSLPADEARIACGQRRISLAGSTGLVVGGDSERRLGDAGSRSRLSESVIARIGPAEAQARHVNHFAGAGVLGGKGTGSTAGRQRHCVTAQDACQCGAAGIDSGGSGGGVNFFRGGGGRGGGGPWWGWWASGGGGVCGGCGGARG